MMLFGLCLLVGIILILVRFLYNIDDDIKDILCIIGSLIVFFSLVIFILIRYDNNPKLSDYQVLKTNYEYVIKNEKIPIEIKHEIYNDLKKYNQ